MSGGDASGRAGGLLLAEARSREGADEVLAARPLVVPLEHDLSEQVRARGLEPGLCPERDGEPDVYRMLLDRRIDVVTFASASAVKNFVKVFGEEAAADLLRMTVVASIGPVTAEAAERQNIKTTIMPHQFTIPALVDAIVEYFAREEAVGAGTDAGRR